MHWQARGAPSSRLTRINTPGPSTAKGVYFKIAGCMVVNPRSKEAELVDVGVKDGIIDAVGEVRARADRVLDAQRDYVCPALVDLHSHVYHLGTSLGVDPDWVASRWGTGVFADAGSSGAGNFAGFLEHVIKRSSSRIYAFLNIGFGGIPFFGIQGGQQAGEVPDMRVADEEACAGCIERNREHIVGVKVRVSENANGALGAELIRAAKRCARKAGVPVMVHFGRSPPEVKEVLSLLEKGDILTHAFRPGPNSIVDEGGHVMREAWDARRRGVVFDVGHGSGSFSYGTARAALAERFRPDTISTDLHAFSAASPVVSLETTMTKMLGLGMEVEEVILAATHSPAAALGRPVHGSIAVGRPADLVTLRVSAARKELKDSAGEAVAFEREVKPVLRLKGEDVRMLPAAAQP